MSESVTETAVHTLQDCLALAGDLRQHPHANQVFTDLQQRLASENPLAAEMLGLVWQEMMSARRSATFWERICDVEREMTEKMAASHLQLQQNYLRLMQEQ